MQPILFVCQNAKYPSLVARLVTLLKSNIAKYFGNIPQLEVN